MRIKKIIILITAFSFMVIAGCSSEEEKSVNAIEKETRTQKITESMFNEENMEEARERLDSQGGSDYVAPDFSDIKENEGKVISLNESNITGGNETTFENHDEYAEARAEELGMSPGYFAEHYSMLWTSAVPAYGIKQLDNGTTSFSLEKYSMFIECQFQSANTELNDKIIKNLRYANENSIPVTVYGEFEEYIDEEGYQDYRLIVHHIIFNEIID